jgi:hypothetical protein
LICRAPVHPFPADLRPVRQGPSSAAVPSRDTRKYRFTFAGPQRILRIRDEADQEIDQPHIGRLKPGSVPHLTADHCAGKHPNLCPCRSARAQA